MPRKGFKMPSEEVIKRTGERHAQFVKKPNNPKGTRAHTKKAKEMGASQCGAKKRQGGKCTLAAGWGTNHPGTGACKFHGGTMPNHVKAAATAEYRKLLGTEMEINPFDALMWCIRLRAGEIKWLTERMAELTKESEWTEETLVGKQFHLFARERQHAMNDLARFSQMAISLGIAERSVRLAEAYGETLARLIRGILEELDLSQEQMNKAPAIVRKHLILASVGTAPESAIAEQSRQKEIAA